MRIKPLFLVGFFLLLACSRICAQVSEQLTDSVSAIFSKYIQTSIDKDMVLLTNRNIYVAGEKIWFKAYKLTEHNGGLDLTSKNLFADIVNEKDSVIEQLVLDNAGVRTEGAFNLPGSLSTGFYWIRCYTAELLRNKNEIFLHPVYVVNKQLHDEGLYAKTFEKNLVKSKLTPFIHFYAERLTAIKGLISTGVIEIRDSYNNPLSATGALLNSKDSVITNFKTNNLGLARLTFLNHAGEIYTAVFYLNNQVLRYQLPAVDKSSIQFYISEQTRKTIKAHVTLEDSVATRTQTTILALRRNNLYWAAVGTGSYGITIPVGDFPGGITTILLFDGKNNLVSQRKIYVSKENVELEVKPNKQKYSARESVNVHFKLTEQNGEPFASILNVAVEDERIQRYSDSMETNTLPPSGDFLLNSWLSRYHTNYSNDDVDMLMITRKSILQQAVDTNFNKEVQDYDDNKNLLNLTGKITNRKGNGIHGRVVNAIAKNSLQFFMDIDTTDHDGMFSLSIPQGFDSLQFSLQVTDKHQVRMPSDSIKIETFQYPNFSTPTTLKQELLFKSFNTLLALKKYHVDTASLFQGVGWLAPVTVKAIKKAEPNYDVSKRLNSISQVLTNDKIRQAAGPDGLINLLRMVPGVSIYGGEIAIFGPFGNHLDPPLVVMDGVPLPSRRENSGSVGVMALLRNLNPADIDFIEVLRGGEAAQFGSRASGGVISINTKRGPDRIDYSKTNLTLFTPITYHVCPKFEMPDYSNSEIKNSSTPDPRTSLYWNGNVATNSNGEADINFYTGDEPANYSITVTGLTKNGDLVYKRIVIGNKGQGR